MSSNTLETARPGAALRGSLWVAQLLLFLGFGAAGFVKLVTPIPELSQMMAWAGQYPVAFVRTIALIDLAGAIGILLPALTRIKPGLTVAAAVGCIALQICAIVFHVSRGEANLIPANFVLLALAIFVFWGRSRKARIEPRGT